MQRIELKGSEDLRGKVIAFETDTVWGLGCLANDEKAVKRIYAMKNRNLKKPLILMSNKIENVIKYTSGLSSVALGLIKKHLPGALTIVVKKSDLCPDYITSGLDTVGIRIPDHKIFREFCEINQNAVLATTSANISTETPCGSEYEVRKKFKDVNLILPSSGHTSNIASTVIRICGTEGEKIEILRQGDIII